jgi:hypothetical protein
VSVAFAIKFLGSKQTPFRGNSHKNTKDLTAIRRGIRNLELALKKASPSALLALYSGEEEWEVTSDLPSTHAVQQAVHDAPRFAVTLAYLRRRCDQLLKGPSGGVHGNAGFLQASVASEAAQLMRQHDLEPADGSDGSTFGNIASLV